MSNQYTRYYIYCAILCSTSRYYRYSNLLYIQILMYSALLYTKILCARRTVFLSTLKHYMYVVLLSQVHPYNKHIHTINVYSGNHKNVEKGIDASFDSIVKKSMNHRNCTINKTSRF